MNPGYVRKGWLGFDSAGGRLLAGEVGHGKGGAGLLRPGALVMIVGKPQLPWRGERLFVHQPVASQFLIHEVKVGNRSSMLCGGAPVPADAFATRMDRLAEVDMLFKRDEVFRVDVSKTGAELLGSEWTLPVAIPGHDVTMVVENVGEQPARFIAGFLGELPELSEPPMVNRWSL